VELTFPVLVCKNCSRPMPLPRPKHLGTSQGQPWWPRGGGPRNFLCPACKHVFEYSAQDVHQQPFGETAQDQARKARSVACVEVPCGAQGCAALLRIRIFAAFDADPREAAIRSLAGATAHDLPCGAGHIVSGPSIGNIGGGTPINAYFDEEWGAE